MGMTARDDCLEQLWILIDRADRADLAVAQDLILRFALSHEGRTRRGAAMTDLSSALARDPNTEDGLELQRAFRAVLLAMIERTGAAVGLEDAPA